MPKFKEKNTRKVFVEDMPAPTLDGKHKEITDELRKKRENEIPLLRKEYRILRARIASGELKIDQELKAKDRLTEIKTTIREIKENERNYFLNNSELVFGYFENKIEVSEGINKTTVLDKFFNKKSGANDNKFEKEDNNVKKYLTNVDETFLDIENYITETDICKTCRNGEMISIVHEGQQICNNCSATVKYLIVNEKPSYREPPKEVSFYAYKRINHFREVIAQFQAKESTQIPEEVLENIKLQIKKERIGLEQITNTRAKEILKRLGYNKYYEHIPFIKDKLGIKPPIMTHELEETLCNLFMDIQAPYAKYCPDDRVNFLNYYYTVYKLCELLDQCEFLPFFPMLKDREKRIEQDEIWKKICDELDWEFIPTI